MGKLVLMAILAGLFIFPTVAHSKDLVILSNKIILGEPVQVEKQISFPQLSPFKPILPIKSTATNLKVVSSKNKEVPFERFGETDYQRLQEYFRKTCLPDKDRWQAADGGWIINQGGITIETEGGYCEGFESLKPTNQTHLIILDYPHMSLPIEYFSLSYNLPKDPLSNTICQKEEYKNERIVFVLPKGAWLWSNSSKTDQIVDEDRVNVILDFSNLEVDKLCFSYGTRQEYSSFESSAFYAIGLFLALAGLFLAGVIGIYYTHYSSIKSRGYLHISFLVSVFVLWLSFLWYVPKIIQIIPPISYTYRIDLSIAAAVLVGIYVLLLAPATLIYKKCHVCKKLLKKNGLEQHIRRQHQ